MTHPTQSLWKATWPPQPAMRLAHDVTTDVAIVGGGISGLTAAVLLARQGRKVVVLERDRIGSGETGNTTSHLTEAVDARYTTITRGFGEDAARLVAQSSRDAIEFIERMSQAQTGFARVRGFLYTERT